MCACDWLGCWDVACVLLVRVATLKDWAVKIYMEATCDLLEEFSAASQHSRSALNISASQRRMRMVKLTSCACISTRVSSRLPPALKKTCGKQLTLLLQRRHANRKKRRILPRSRQPHKVRRRKYCRMKRQNRPLSRHKDTRILLLWRLKAVRRPQSK